VILEKLIEVPIDDISINPQQPRKHFSASALGELADSIRTVGILHPPLVRPCGKGFELISGERRWRAARLAGLLKIPVVVRHTTENRLTAQAALIENIQRVDLNPIEIAQALRTLLHQYSLTQEKIADQVGKPRSTVTNYLRLLNLPEPIQISLSEEQISMGHAKALLTLKESRQQILLHSIILREQLSVRQTELWVNKRTRDSSLQKRKPLGRNVQLEQIAMALQEKIGAKVQVQGKGSKGKVIFNYYSLNDLDKILDFFDLRDSF